MVIMPVPFGYAVEEDSSSREATRAAAFEPDPARRIFNTSSKCHPLYPFESEWLTKPESLMRSTRMLFSNPFALDERVINDFDKENVRNWCLVVKYNLLFINILMKVGIDFLKMYLFFSQNAWVFNALGILLLLCKTTSRYRARVIWRSRSRGENGRLFTGFFWNFLSQLLDRMASPLVPSRFKISYDSVDAVSLQLISRRTDACSYPNRHLWMENSGVAIVMISLIWHVNIPIPLVRNSLSLRNSLSFDSVMLAVALFALLILFAVYLRFWVYYKIADQKSRQDMRLKQEHHPGGYQTLDSLNSQWQQYQLKHACAVAQLNDWPAYRSFLWKDATSDRDKTWGFLEAGKWSLLVAKTFRFDSVVSEVKSNIKDMTRNWYSIISYLDVLTKDPKLGIVLEIDMKEEKKSLWNTLAAVICSQDNCYSSSSKSKRDVGTSMSAHVHALLRHSCVRHIVNCVFSRRWWRKSVTSWYCTRALFPVLSACFGVTASILTNMMVDTGEIRRMFFENTASTLPFSISTIQLISVLLTCYCCLSAFEVRLNCCYCGWPGE